MIISITFSIIWFLLFLYSIQKLVSHKIILKFTPNKKVFLHILVLFACTALFRISINQPRVSGDWYSWFAAPLWEEFARIGLLSYPVLNSILFSLAHFRIIETELMLKLFLMYFFIGITLNYILKYEKNIGNTILCHMFINFFYFSYGFENWFIKQVFLVLAILGCVFYIFFLRKSHKSIGATL